MAADVAGAAPIATRIRTASQASSAGVAARSPIAAGPSARPSPSEPDLLTACSPAPLYSAPTCAAQTCAEPISQGQTSQPRVSLRGALSEVIRQVAIELGNGQPVPIGLRRAVLRMADLLRSEMQPSGD